MLWVLTATLPLTVTLKTSGSSEWLSARAMQVVSRLLSALSPPDTAQPCLLPSASLTPGRVFRALKPEKLMAQDIARRILRNRDDNPFL